MAGTSLVGLAALVIAGAAACGSATPTDRLDAEVPDLESSMRAYVESPGLRRRALEQSLVNPSNAYATLRLRSYDEAHWGALPEFDPPTAPILVGEDGTPAAAPPAGDPTWRSLEASHTGWSLEDLRALGERAFFRYPLQTADTLPAALASPDHAGVWQDQGRFGAVWVALPRGLVRAATTCSTCHASSSGGRLVAGRNNADLDAQRIFDNDARAASSAGGSFGAWGPGVVDVTPDGVENPVAITDLRPVRYQQHLHHAGTLRNDPIALAVRIETLMITSHSEAVRPPRKIAAALAVYLLGLAPTTPLPRGEGAVVFARECGGCHAGESASGPPISLAAIGTDPGVGASTDRGTGSYRVPSLRAVGDRRRMFANGAIEDIDALLAPDRKAPGHRYGLNLDERERKALLGYLRAL